MLHRLLQIAAARPVVFVGVLALVIRGGVALLISTVLPGLHAPDEWIYHELARGMAAGDTSQFDEYMHDLFFNAGTYVIPVTLVYSFFGPAELWAQLVSGLFGAAAAALVAVSAREHGRFSALFGGTVVALFPSQVYFSSLVLKDAAVWAVLAATAAATAWVWRGAGRRATAGAIMLLGVCLFLLAHLRAHSVVVACWTLLISTVVLSAVPVWRNLRRAAAVAALAVLLPVATGLGPAGIGYVTDTAGSVDERRAALGRDAATAFVRPTAAPPAGPGPILRHPAGDAASPDGVAATVPRRDLPPPIALARPDASSEPVIGPRSLVRGVSVMLLEPYPWDRVHNAALALAKAETALAWYPLLVLGALGLWAARRRPHSLMFPAVYTAGIVGAYAVAEGNLGTAFRHRGEFVWAVVLLAVGGAHALASRRALASRPPDAPARPLSAPTDPPETARAHSQTTPRSS